MQNISMFHKIIPIVILFIFVQVFGTEAQSYEDARCKCVCTIKNGTKIRKQLYVANVPPNNDCSGINVPAIEDANNKTELCPRCTCTYESRNTTIIKVVVIIVIWIISLLVIYMVFLICLDPLLNKRAKSSYVEHTNEEDDSSSVCPRMSSHAMGVRGGGGVGGGGGGVGGNVLNRVGHQQDKWKRQVREQRRKIYDTHTMLN